MSSVTEQILVVCNALEWYTKEYPTSVLYTHDESSGHTIENTVAKKTVRQIRHMQSARWEGWPYKYRVKYEAAFLYTDWPYFLRHGIKLVFYCYLA